jgi:hypothetical protein
LLDESCSKYQVGIFPIVARGKGRNRQQLIFKDGNQIRALDAETEEDVSEILEYIHANGYDLIAIEGQPWKDLKVNEKRPADE